MTQSGTERPKSTHVGVDNVNKSRIRLVQSTVLKR